MAGPSLDIGHAPVPVMESLGSSLSSSVRLEKDVRLHDELSLCVRPDRVAHMEKSVDETVGRWLTDIDDRVEVLGCHVVSPDGENAHQIVTDALPKDRFAQLTSLTPRIVPGAVRQIACPQVGDLPRSISVSA